MQRHYKGTSGYALLYLFQIFFITVLTLLCSSLVSALGMQDVNKLVGIVIFAAFWICGFVVMQRFLFVENRRPTISESNAIGLKSVLFIFCPIICVVLLVGIGSFVVSLFSAGGGAEEAGRAAQNRNSGDQAQQAMGALLGVFGTMLLLYLAPFLNLAVASRLFAPNSKPA